MDTSSLVPHASGRADFVAPFARTLMRSLPPISNVAKARRRLEAVLGFDPPTQAQVDGGIWSRIDCGHFSASCAARIARQTFSGVAGMSIWAMPSGLSASTTALLMAARAPTLPASPAPLTPKGLVLVGTGFSSVSKEETPSARGRP